MTSSVIRTAVVTSLVTAVVVSALAVYALPRMTANGNTNDSPYTLQPAMASAPAQDYSYAAPPHARLRRAYYPPAAPQQTYSQSAAYSEPVAQPVVHKHRSFAKSALIVGGSSAAGAGIGALAGGKKGAGIGAIAGGLGGLIYDRVTANK